MHEVIESTMTLLIVVKNIWMWKVYFGQDMSIILNWVLIAFMYATQSVGVHVYLYVNIGGACSRLLWI